MSGCLCQRAGKTGVANPRGFCLVCGEAVDPVVASEDAEAQEAAPRAAFEAWISLPPIEASLRRLPDDSSWPGQYADSGVQLAWEAWQAAHASLAPTRRATTPRA